MPGSLRLDVAVEAFAYREPFRISGHVFNESRLVVVTLSDGLHVGRGEAAGVYFLGDDVAAMLAAIEGVRARVEAGATRLDLQGLLPPGGARNALDCAFWELEARKAGIPVWRLADVPEPRPLRTTLTLGADTPARMADAARRLTEAKALKLKLTGEIDRDRDRVVQGRRARPDCWIGVDANQGYAVDGLPALLETLLANDVRLLEQPLARGREADLDGFPRPLPFVADESVVSLADVDAAAGRFDLINIKLDKCGGLTEGLAMARRARALGLGVMVGNMMGSSLSMAPAFLLGQVCDIVDLDGPIFLARDRTPAVEYRDGDIACAPEVWGAETP